MHFNKETYIKIRMIGIIFKVFAYYINKDFLLSYNTRLIEDIRERILIGIVNETINFDISGRQFDNMHLKPCKCSIHWPHNSFILLTIAECLPNAKYSRYVDEQHRPAPCSQEASILVARETMNKHIGEYRR